MCFTSDYDWYASVVINEVLAVPIPEEEHARMVLRCGECNRFIEPGEQYRRIYQQEHEQCWPCFEEDDKDACDCEEPDYGESYETHRCMNCDKLLDAIAASEKEEGCRADESRPPLDAMFDCLSEFDPADIERYISKARELSPELESNGYLAFVESKLQRT